MSAIQTARSLDLERGFLAPSWHDAKNPHDANADSNCNRDSYGDCNGYRHRSCHCDTNGHCYSHADSDRYV